MNARRTTLLICLTFVGGWTHGCGFTYEPDPGSMASFSGPEPSRGAGGSDNADESLFIVMSLGDANSEASCPPMAEDAGCDDPTPIRTMDAGVADDAAVSGEAALPGQQGDPCSETRTCGEDLVCLHDPDVIDEASGEVLPYCTQLCSESECNDGYTCVALEPVTSVCRLQTEE